MYNKFCKAKYSQKKQLLYQRFKTYRNLLSNLTKNVKKLYCQENKNNLVKIILIKKPSRIQPKCLKIYNNLIYDGKKKIHEFNNLF